jgi:hypothetical protein
MPAFIRYITLLPSALWLMVPAAAPAGTFGTVVPIRGQLSDLAIDKYRGVIYAANFPANRVEVINQQSLALGTPIQVNYPPSSIALSPDGTYLVIGQYVDITTTAMQTSAVNSLTIVNLVTNQTQSLSLGTASVLSVAFGNSPKALMVLSNGVSLLDPVKGVIQPLAASGSTTVPTPVPWATTSPSIIKASSGISGDGNVLVSLIDGPPQSLVVRYQIDVGGLNIVSIVSSPTLGPRVVSVDQTGAHSLDAWGLDSFVNGGLYTAGQFPYATGNLNVGTHAWDSARNLIYAQMSPGTDQTPGATATGAAPLLQVFDSDNLTVEETLQLRENLTGRSLLNGDSMYSISESGLTVLPIGTLSQSHRVASAQEDVYIQAGGCDQRPVTQSFSIVDPGGGATDFTLNVNSPGVTVYPLSGTTPAQIQVTVDPTQFQSNKGTAVIPMQISSVLGVNLPKSVRLLVNTNDPNQQGAIYNVPGTLVDVLADPIYDRFYVLRQDMNQVLVFDGTSLAQIATLRTGTTPLQMAIADGELLVTADNTQYLNVFDLATLTPRTPVYLPSGQYGRSIAASNSHILLTSRSAAGTPELIGVDLTINSAAPLSSGIFTKIIDPAAVLASSPSGNTVYMAMPDGTVALFDDLAGKFLASRKDLTSLSGAFSALSDDLFIAGANRFRRRAGADIADQSAGRRGVGRRDEQWAGSAHHHARRRAQWFDPTFRHLNRGLDCTDAPAGISAHRSGDDKDPGGSGGANDSALHPHARAARQRQRLHPAFHLRLQLHARDFRCAAVDACNLFNDQCGRWRPHGRARRAGLALGFRPDGRERGGLHGAVAEGPRRRLPVPGFHSPAPVLRVAFADQYATAVQSGPGREPGGAQRDRPERAVQHPLAAIRPGDLPHSGGRSHDHPHGGRQVHHELHADPSQRIADHLHDRFGSGKRATSGRVAGAFQPGGDDGFHSRDHHRRQEHLDHILRSRSRAGGRESGECAGAL